MLACAGDDAPEGACGWTRMRLRGGDAVDAVDDTLDTLDGEARAVRLTGEPVADPKPDAGLAGVAGPAPAAVTLTAPLAGTTTAS